MIFIITILFLISLCSPLLAEGYSDNVVTITVITQSFDYNSPWQKKTVYRKVISGTVIKGNIIITESYPLADHVIIEVSKKGRDRKYPAELIIKDYNCGLALLRVEDETFFADLEPISLYDDRIIEGDKGVITKYEKDGVFKEYPTIFLKASIEFYQSYSPVLIYTMTADLYSGGNGEPVFMKGKLAGITSWFDSKRNLIKVIAVDVIKRMLRDLDDKVYDSIPYFFIEENSLKDDENLRESLGLANNDTGVHVKRVPPKTSGSDVIKSGDVILSIDGINIDDNGLYNSEKYGRLSYYGLIYLDHLVGDTLRLKIIRDKKPMDISLELKPISKDSFLIQTISYDHQPQYYIFGGLIIQELSRGYLETWGKEWTKRANRRFMFFYDNYTEWPNPERKSIVILNRVLPASVNLGYHEMENLILHKINGKEIIDIKHAKKTIESSKEKYIRFDFLGFHTIILDRDRVTKSNREILKRYNINIPYNIRN